MAARRLRLLAGSPGQPTAAASSATNGRLRAEVLPGPPTALSLRDLASAAAPPRFIRPLPGLPAITALAFSPDGNELIVGGPGGTVVWLDVRDGSQRLRLQLVPGGGVLLGSEGRFALLGAVERPADYVICGAAGYAVPYPLCAERRQLPALSPSPPTGTPPR
jgi:hypothetical protein